MWSRFEPTTVLNIVVAVLVVAALVVAIGMTEAV